MILVKVSLMYCIGVNHINGLNNTKDKLAPVAIKNICCQLIFGFIKIKNEIDMTIPTSALIDTINPMSTLKKINTEDLISLFSLIYKENKAKKQIRRDTVIEGGVENI